MIPYFQADTIPFWPWPIRVWGLLVALGLVAAAIVGAREARRRGLSAGDFLDFAAYVVVAGVVGARLGFILLYAPTAAWDDPWSVLRVWEGGMSLLGAGFGVIVAVILLRRRFGPSLLPLAEVAAFVYPLGEAIGRVGCFLIHDHPGRPWSGFLSVNFPDGPRTDHGLLLSLAFAVLFVVFWLLNRHRPKSPFFLPLLLLAWGLIRVILDFWRAGDFLLAETRYFGVTPAQYGGLIMIAVGVVWLARRRKA
jgi:phosphatidylglycerol:prolipoprotein diacylglycerol transferase